MMSSTDGLFIVVEGKDLDRPFYDLAASSSVKVNAAGYQIWLIEQIRDDVSQNATGGKSAVLSFYDFCRRRKALTIYVASEKRSIAFCIDNDGEHISGGRRRSPSVIYTRSSDVEAEIFTWGDEVKALGNALGIHRSMAEALVKQLGDWRLDLATVWREWIELCCLSKALRSRCSVGFKRLSTINDNTYEALDPIRASQARQLVIAKGLFDEARSKRIESIIARRVLRHYTNGESWLLVKGKWYPGYLMWRISGMSNLAPMQTQGVERFLAKSFLNTLDPTDDWTEYYRLKFEALV